MGAFGGDTEIDIPVFTAHGQRNDCAGIVIAPSWDPLGTNAMWTVALLKAAIYSLIAA